MNHREAFYAWLNKSESSNGYQADLFSAWEAGISYCKENCKKPNCILSRALINLLNLLDEIDTTGLYLEEKSASDVTKEANLALDSSHHASQWQPIDTAPKDGTNILAFTAEGQCEVYWDRFKWVQVPCYSTYDGCGSAVLMCDPTHWQPLPPEPSK